MVLVLQDDWTDSQLKLRVSKDNKLVKLGD